jgi:CheY-like chemotaxis protein
MLSVVPIAPPTHPLPAEVVVLLVDDHEPSLVRLRMVVETAGYACAAVDGPADALAFCESRRPALVVTDLAMPDLDGHTLARRLKSRYPSLPILLLTGEALTALDRAAFGPTFEAVLTKPLDVGPFLSLLDGLIPPSARAGGGRRSP